jgi:hypothetical protein
LAGAGVSEVATGACRVGCFVTAVFFAAVFLVAVFLGDCSLRDDGSLRGDCSLRDDCPEAGACERRRGGLDDCCSFAAGSAARRRDVGAGAG